MKITDIRIKKCIRPGPMKAIVSVTLDNEMAIHDIKVIYAQERYFVVMPNRKNFDGTYRDIVHPINSSSRNYFEKEIISAYMALSDNDSDAAEIEA